MKAMIFAAGLGTRLMPLTHEKPKALVSLRGKPLLQIVIEKLIRQGFTEVIVNVHHFGEQVQQFLSDHENFGIRIAVSDEQDELLDTGGGILKASWFFDDNRPFLVHNVDVLSDIDLQAMARVHSTSGALATLAVRKRTTTRYLMFDDALRLCGWKNLKTGEQVLARPGHRTSDYAFSGIHMISPEIFKLITEKGRFSIINTYLRLAEKHPIQAYPHDQSVWKDVGKPQDLADVENDSAFKF